MSMCKPSCAFKKWNIKHAEKWILQYFSYKRQNQKKKRKNASNASNALVLCRRGKEKKTKTK